MLECNRFVKKKMSVLTRSAALLLVAVCVVVLLSQTVLAKNTYLINDGNRVMVHTTFATDPAAVLNEIGLELGKDDTYVTQNGLGVSEITVQRKQTITIIHGNKTMEVTSYGETVEALLNRLNLILTPEDMISLPLDAATYDGMVLPISKTTQTEETYTVAVPHSTVYCYDATLAAGEEKVLTPGVDGQLLCNAAVYYVDGTEVNRVVVSQVVTRQPVNAVVAVGTYVEQPEPIPMPTEPKPTQPKPTLPKPTNPLPDAPIMGSAPIIVGNTITTSTGQVLTYTKKLDCEATAYSCDGKPGYTYSGTPARVGAIAVDPKFIPLGTRMYIVTNDGDYIYGIATAEDIGGAIKGNIIDLYFDSFAECYQFGRRACTVYILEDA